MSEALRYDAVLLRRTGDSTEPVDEVHIGDRLVVRVTNTGTVALSVALVAEDRAGARQVLDAAEAGPGQTVDLEADAVRGSARVVAVEATGPDGDVSRVAYPVVVALPDGLELDQYVMYERRMTAANGGGEERTLGMSRAEPPDMAPGMPEMADTGAEPPPPEPPEPAEGGATRTAYGRLDAPDAAVAAAEWEVVVGLAAAPSAGTVAAPMTVPDPIAGEYVLTVVLTAAGCALRAGESWRNDLPVTVADPYPTVALHLTSPVGSRTLQAIYTIAGGTVGMATRPVEVVATAAEAATAPPHEPPGATLTYAAGDPVPDVEIVILTDPHLPAGSLIWHAWSRHDGVVPVDGTVTSVGAHPRDFATGLVRKVDKHGGQPDLARVLRGIGRDIADEIPAPVLAAVRAAAAAVQGPPTVLLLSAEAYVPWELAVLEPPLDPALPPFLGAQAAVGRWVPQGNAARPPLPPPPRLAVRTVTVVTAAYDHPTWPALPGAVAEGSAIVATYGGTAITADQASVLAELDRTPCADVLHVALHGKYDPDADEYGIVLLDGTLLTPDAVHGSDFAGTPFVFLNACQVGSGDETLGDAAGLPDAFLSAGAAAVVAPLWSVEDAVAGGVAEGLYASAFSGVPLGEAIRAVRATYLANPAAPNRTALAYQLFGHPCLTLTRTEANDG